MKKQAPPVDPDAITAGTIRLRNRYWDALTQMAEADKRKRSDWLRLAIEELVDQRGVAAKAA